MDRIIKNEMEGKKVLILGFGREGESTYQLLRRILPMQRFCIADCDDKLKQKFPVLSTDQNLDFFLGGKYLDRLGEFDLIIKSPGISLKDIQYNLDLSKISSQTDLFFRRFADQIIGITGTKGKSTTSSLIYHIISQTDKNVVLIGNIGIPPFTMLDKINSETRIVCEVSSHQLEYLTVAPHISILLNLYQEHLDHYKTYEDYQNAKWNIFQKQSAQDYFIFNSDDVLIKKYLENNSPIRNYFSFSFSDITKNGCFIKDGKISFVRSNQLSEIVEINEKRHLIGRHNLLNIMAAIDACMILNIAGSDIKEGICSFKGLSHRLEYVGCVDSVCYYNDSISTIPEATIQAVDALECVDTLILGGFDRGIDYGNLIDFLSKSDIMNFIFISDAGKRMLDLFNKKGNLNKNFFFVNDFKSAVDHAKQKTQPGKICLLSPAAASYGMFNNFEERGNTFKELVLNRSSA